MEEQSSGEFASANPATRAKDARLQKPRISPEFSLNTRSRLQRILRSTPSHIGLHIPSISRIGNEHMPSDCCCSLNRPEWAYRGRRIQQVVNAIQWAA